MEENAGSFSKIKSIVKDGIEDVYCMDVPETHNFVANSIVIHNCLDALRYAVYSHKISVYDYQSHNQQQQTYMQNRFQRGF